MMDWVKPHHESPMRQRHLASSTVFILLKRQDQVCLIKRAATGWLDDHYSLPAGGVEAGETLRAAAQREAREEVGIEIVLEDLALGHILHCRSGTQDWTGHVFVTDRWQGEPFIAEPDKHSDLGWYGLADLPDPMVPYVRHALAEFARGEAYSEYGWD